MAGFYPEEGDLCPNCIGGRYIMPPPDNCSCHISPPCPACMEPRLLVCNNCGHTAEREE